MMLTNLLVIYKEGEAVSIPRASVEGLAVSGESVVCRLTDGSTRIIGPYESYLHATQVFTDILTALATGVAVLDIWRIRPVKK